MASIERSFETGTIVGVLTLLLAATGIALSPSLFGSQNNALYVAHVVLGLLLTVAVVVHFAPVIRRVLKQLDSAALVAILAVEVWTGIELWRHWYFPFPKAIAVLVHLALTLPLALPLATHAWRGTRSWWANRAAARAVIARQPPERAWRTEAGIARRTFLRVSAYAVAGVALAWTFGRAATAELMEWRVNSIGRTPALTKENWQLRVTGLVNKPITLTWAQLQAMRQVELRFVHHCVEGWTYEDTFTGVPLPDIINAAGGAKPGAQMLIFKSPETSRHPFTFGQQYTTSFPFADGLHDDVLLVHKAHGADLPPIHGFPVRLMTPRKWGYKACKWLTEIEVSSDASFRGYWERAGYHPDGDYPGPIFG